MNPAIEFQEKRIRRARTALLLRSAFFASLVLRLKLVAREDIPTAATDGIHLFWSPQFVSKLDDLELIGLIAHEVMHCACSHITRRGARNPLKWNICADWVVNAALIDAGYKLPKGALIDEQFAGMYVEKVYAMLPDPPPQGGSKGKPGDGDGFPQTEGGFGQIIDPTDDAGEPLTTEQREQLDQEWRRAATAAKEAARRAGNQPGALERLVGEALRPKVNWREVLRRFFQAASEPRDYSWTPLNKKFISMGFSLPSIKREGVGLIVVQVDVSGSITRDLLSQWGAELNSIVGELQPEKVIVIYWDTQVQGIEEFGPGDDVILRTRGGGGTDARASFQWIEDEGLNPLCSVVLTDMYIGGFPDHEPDFPVLWATPTRDYQEPPWGEVVLIEES